MTLSGDNDLGFVRHQLDDLNLARCMGAMSDEDERRYQELCDLERCLLKLPQNRRMMAGHEVWAISA